MCYSTTLKRKTCFCFMDYIEVLRYHETLKTKTCFCYIHCIKALYYHKTLKKKHVSVRY